MGVFGAGVGDEGRLSRGREEDVAFGFFGANAVMLYRMIVDGHEKVLARGAPATVVGEAAAADDLVHMGMIEELPGPGVEHADQADSAADEARILGQFL